MINIFQDILSNSSIDIRLRRKAVFLVADLAECQLENIHKVELPFFSNRLFLKSVVDLTASADLDLQEKVSLELLLSGLVFYVCPCFVDTAALVAEIIINLEVNIFVKNQIYITDI